MLRVGGLGYGIATMRISRVLAYIIAKRSVLSRVQNTTENSPRLPPRKSGEARFLSCLLSILVKFRQFLRGGVWDPDFQLCVFLEHVCKLLRNCTFYTIPRSSGKFLPPTAAKNPERLDFFHVCCQFWSSFVNSLGGVLQGPPPHRKPNGILISGRQK